MNIEEVMDKLKELSNPIYLSGMKRFGIDSGAALGVPVPKLRKLAKTIGKDHALALKLWETGVHEARILAFMVDEPKQVTAEQCDQWVRDFHSWDICDQVCGNLFDRTPFALEKAVEYSWDEQEFIKRAGFVLMAESAMHNKTGNNEMFLRLLPIIEREAGDDRNFVKKAVNWALRQIGKRNNVLLSAAIDCANRILLQNTKAAKWTATDALTELNAKARKLNVP